MSKPRLTPSQRRALSLFGSGRRYVSCHAMRAAGVRHVTVQAIGRAGLIKPVGVYYRPFMERRSGCGFLQNGFWLTDDGRALIEGGEG